VTLASCLYDICRTTMAAMHSALCEQAPEISPAVSGDENLQPSASSASERKAAPMAAALAPVERLHALQTFNACLYTQDIVPEAFIHSIIDRARRDTGEGSATGHVAAVHGACDMMKFCGKRLESLGVLKHVMPDFYSYLQGQAQGGELPAQTESLIEEILQLRANNWIIQAPTGVTDGFVESSAVGEPSTPAATES
jgi:hypothetical protein